jgi:hypothetical protein
MNRNSMAAAGAAVILAAGTAGCAVTARAAQPEAMTAHRFGPPVSAGRLHITGSLRDGGTVTASGKSWRPGRIGHGDRLLSFEVGYTWRACAGSRCTAGADSTVTPFAARRYVVGHADTGRRLEVTETATEVVETNPATFSFSVSRASASATTAVAVGAYPRGKLPVTEFVNGLPEHRTGSRQEYFSVDPPHFNAADGPVRQWFRIDLGPRRPMPARHVFSTGQLSPGKHSVTVLTSDHAGSSGFSFTWRVVPLPAPLACAGTCWYPPHLDSTGHPMRWDWQIGRVAPLQRTGKRAVDIYDIDGFLTTAAQVRQIHTSWQASTLAHPRAICYLDLAWEDYRPDGSPAPRGLFPAAALGRVYFGFAQERWVDFRQLDALKPMLTERISMCARKGFDAVELDDIDSFDPVSTTGFHLTPGDAQNYLAYAFNLVHSYGMTVLWKNAPGMAWWGVRYTDGAVVEECYTFHECFAASQVGTHQDGIVCTMLSGPTPCGWDVFTADKTSAQPTGKWVGEAEYGADHYVCNPGQSCRGGRAYAVFCRRVYAPPDGFTAVKFDVNLDGHVFFPCPSGT